MCVSIVHLSDLHFGLGPNEIERRLNALASAICSADPSCHEYILAISGDIANTGAREEYTAAQAFIEELRRTITAYQEGNTVSIISVPGNHDCQLPGNERALRNVLCQGIASTMQTAVPDEPLMTSLLSVQTNYFEFTSSLFNLPESDPERIFAERIFKLGPRELAFRLYNTAICSKREESQELLVPMDVLRNAPFGQNAPDLVVSMFHHPYNWLQADVAVAFRDYVESTSEIVLTGHQHYDHGFTKNNLAGEKVFYSEGALLQSRENPNESGFRVIVCDLAESKRRVITYSWHRGHYVSTNDSDWLPYERHLSRLSLPVPATAFLARLSDAGIGLIHPTKGLLPLDAIFIFPDATARDLSDFQNERKVSSSLLFEHITKTPKLIIAGGALSGKTSLMKRLSKEWLRTGTFYPLMISGNAFANDSQSQFEKVINSEIVGSYGQDSIERYLQLPRERRALLLDDWDSGSLSILGKDRVVQLACSYFGKIVLSFNGLPYLDQLQRQIGQGNAMLGFEALSLKEMSFELRGKLIDRWLELDLRSGEEDARRIEETERLVTTIIGKNTLPSLPFFVLTILQAAQREMTILPENGSFGYLYEVLITTALNTSVTGKPQLDKKFAFLPQVASRMFAESVDFLPVSTVEQMLGDYAKSYRIKIDVNALLKDLEYARVLVRQAGNYLFGYTHYFQYFLARHFKYSLGGPEHSKIRVQLSGLARGLNYGSNGTFLMFFLYLTHDEELTDELIGYGREILAEFEESHLTDEVAFFNDKDHAGLERQIPLSEDLAANRQLRRESQDQVNVAEGNQGRDSAEISTEAAGYSSELPLATKLDYARRCIEILGQVLRNFTGALPGERKLAILEATYRLGLRTLRALMDSLNDLTVNLRDDFAKHEPKASEDYQLVKRLETLLTVVAQIAGSAVFHMISMNVGSAEIDRGAYADTKASVGPTNSAELVDLAIKLDHLEEYPLSDIKRLHRKFANNRFALIVLRDLVIANLQVFDVGREMRQRVLAMFGQSRMDEALLSKSNKRIGRSR